MFGLFSPSVILATISSLLVASNAQVPVEGKTYIIQNAVDNQVLNIGNQIICLIRNIRTTNETSAPYPSHFLWEVEPSPDAADKFVIWSFNKSLTYSLNDLRYWGFALCSINSRQITFTPVGEDGYVLIRENPTFCLESLPWGTGEVNWYQCNENQERQRWKFIETEVE